MHWHHIQYLNESRFKRLTGVRPRTFTEMVGAVNDHRIQTRRHPSRGRPPKLCVEDQVLLTLMYLREYRTMFHIGEAYGLSEAMVCRTIRYVESILVGHPAFRLPGKKALLKADAALGVVLLDASEHPIERPKKNNAGITPAKRNGTPSKPSM